MLVSARFYLYKHLFETLEVGLNFSFFPEVFNVISGCLRDFFVG